MIFPHINSAKVLFLLFIPPCYERSRKISITSHSQKLQTSQNFTNFQIQSANLNQYLKRRQTHGVYVNMLHNAKNRKWFVATVQTKGITKIRQSINWHRQTIELQGHPSLGRPFVSAFFAAKDNNLNNYLSPAKNPVSGFKIPVAFIRIHSSSFCARSLVWSLLLVFARSLAGGWSFFLIAWSLASLTRYLVASPVTFASDFARFVGRCRLLRKIVWRQLVVNLWSLLRHLFASLVGRSLRYRRH